MIIVINGRPIDQLRLVVIGRVGAKQLPDASCVIYIMLLMILLLFLSVVLLFLPLPQVLLKSSFTCDRSIF